MSSDLTLQRSQTLIGVLPREKWSDLPVIGDQAQSLHHGSSIQSQYCIKKSRIELGALVPHQAGFSR
jgi:hypothetical protein